MSDPPAETNKSEHEPVGLHAVRPYLIVGDADAAIDFYRTVFDATELERHVTPAGGVGHAKIGIGETIVEIGEHPNVMGREVERLPAPPTGWSSAVRHRRRRHIRTGAGRGRVGRGTSDQLSGARVARVHDPFGLTWWLAATIAP
jgi:PhnB protein